MKCDWPHLYKNTNMEYIIIVLPHSSVLHSKAQHTCLIQIFSWNMNVDFSVIVSIVFKRTSESKINCNSLLVVRVPSVKALHGDLKKSALLTHDMGKAWLPVPQTLRKWRRKSPQHCWTPFPGSHGKSSHVPQSTVAPSLEAWSPAPAAYGHWRAAPSMAPKGMSCCLFRPLPSCNMFSRAPFTEMQCYRQGPVF